MQRLDNYASEEARNSVDRLLAISQEMNTYQSLYGRDRWLTQFEQKYLAYRLKAIEGRG